MCNKHIICNNHTCFYWFWYFNGTDKNKSRTTQYIIFINDHPVSLITRFWISFYFSHLLVLLSFFPPFLFVSVYPFVCLLPSVSFIDPIFFWLSAFLSPSRSLSLTHSLFISLWPYLSLFWSPLPCKLLGVKTDFLK